LKKIFYKRPDFFLPDIFLFAHVSAALKMFRDIYTSL